MNFSNIPEELRTVAVKMMEHSGYSAKLMQSDLLTDNKRPHELPPGVPISVIPIHSLPGCPKGWVREAGSYVCPIETNHGLWFDWTNNDKNTAIVASVKGMNPITGEKLENLNMEQYRDKCPKHNISLAHGRFCEKCGYKLPPQNYISYPNTLWWDGFRQPDGTVRQFYFTDEEKKDIASLVIGKKNTVPAFGFGFFKTKRERFIQEENSRSFCSTVKSIKMNHYESNDNTLTINDGIVNLDYTDCRSVLLHATNTVNYSCNVNNTVSTFCSAPQEGIQLQDTPVRALRAVRDVSVGAGARIKQDLMLDKLALNEYNSEPQAIIRLYFVFQEQLQDILQKGGIKHIENKNTGFLDGLPVG